MQTPEPQDLTEEELEAMFPPDAVTGIVAEVRAAAYEGAAKRLPGQPYLLHQGIRSAALLQAYAEALAEDADGSTGRAGALMREAVQALPEMVLTHMAGLRAGEFKLFEEAGRGSA